ncbi:hypothetical protein [Streptomyces sp. NPDC051561]|uniref:hypothetical protein n=1 Tax=Streptomyces sp. NPDC051561 TaxID=3365658 RepID=UPI00379A7F97
MVEQQEASEDAVMTRIGQTAMLLHAGDREEARSRFGALWEEIGARGDPGHRCLLAHYMADAQDDPRDELLWDLRALAAAEGAAGEAAAAGLDGFHPSLHLGLARDYAKLGRPEAARSHLRRARESCAVLVEDSYGHGVRAEIGRLEERLAGE